MEGAFVVEDFHNFGADYDRTFMAWSANFEEYAASPQFAYDRRFYKMWRYFLQIFAGAFRSRVSSQLWQIVASKRGVAGGYISSR